MHIEIRPVKLLALITLLLIACTARSQDTVNIRPFERYWTQPRIIPKIGLGVQDVGFIDAGVQLHQIYVHPLSLASAGPYLTVEGVILEDDFILGPKLGYEVTAGLIGLAVDFTYYTDFEREALMITPKAGLSVLGFVDLFYGYNISVSEDSFKSISKNRFSLIFNVNPDYFNLKAAGKRHRKLENAQ